MVEVLALMVFDWDDFSWRNHRLDLLGQLKAVRPDFKCTVFAIPEPWRRSPFWSAIPDWIEMAQHGYMHGDPPTDGGECKDWTYATTVDALAKKPARFVKGFKAPGWQISDGCYEALLEQGWWVADQPYNNDRRPKGLRCHLLGAEDHWHGHIQNVCGNGLEETFAHVMQLVREAESFEFMSEVVQPWK